MHISTKVCISEKKQASRGVATFFKSLKDAQLPEMEVQILLSESTYIFCLVIKTLMNFIGVV